MKSYAQKFERVNCKQSWTGKWLTWHTHTPQRILHAETESIRMLVAGTRKCSVLRFEIWLPICSTCLFNDFGFCILFVWGTILLYIFQFWEMWPKKNVYKLRTTCKCMWLAHWPIKIGWFDFWPAIPHNITQICGEIRTPNCYSRHLLIIFIFHTLTTMNT